jgi:hypothetical protein
MLQVAQIVSRCWHKHNLERMGAPEMPVTVHQPRYRMLASPSVDRSSDTLVGNQ